MRYLKKWERALPGGKGTPGEGGSVKLCLSLFHQCGHAESDPPRGRWTEGVTRQNRFYGGKVSQAKQMRPTLKEKPTLSTAKHWQKGSCEKAGAQGRLHRKHEACGLQEKTGWNGIGKKLFTTFLRLQTSLCNYSPPRGGFQDSSFLSCHWYTQLNLKNCPNFSHRISYFPLLWVFIVM